MKENGEDEVDDVRGQEQVAGGSDAGVNGREGRGHTHEGAKTSSGPGVAEKRRRIHDFRSRR